MTSLDSVTLPPDYEPENDSEYMSLHMRKYFQNLLNDWKKDILRGMNDTVSNTLQTTELQKPDIADRASAETDHALELRTRDRERKLLKKIDEAIGRIRDDDYGYCEETGDEIGVKRLKARPTATLSLEAQERHEKMEKVQRED